jgi:hypothetical protein
MPHRFRPVPSDEVKSSGSGTGNDWDDLTNDQVVNCTQADMQDIF